MCKSVFTVNELAGYLKVSESAVRKLVRTKQIPYYRILSKIFFDKDTIDNWINNQQIQNLQFNSDPTQLRYPGGRVM